MKPDVFARFSKCVGDADSNGCVPWIGAKASTGYGVIRRNGTTGHVKNIKGGRCWSHITAVAVQ